MKILLNNDANIELSSDERDQIETDIDLALARFESDLTRVEAHFSDQSAGRSTGDDVVCQLEARPSGLDPQSVSHSAPSVDEALRGALRKVTRVLESTLGRLDTRKRAQSMGGAEAR